MRNLTKENVVPSLYEICAQWLIMKKNEETLVKMIIAKQQAKTKI